MHETIHNVLSGNASEAEQIAFASWLSESEENRSAFEQQKAFWDLLGHGRLEEEIDSNESWARFVAKQTPSNTRSLWYYVAAIAVLVLLAAAYFYPNQSLTESKYVAQQIDLNTTPSNEVEERSTSSIPTTFKTALKKFQKRNDTTIQFAEVDLTDSSVATITNTSVLKVLDQSPKQSRIASLSGAGLFDIKSTEQDFVLETEHLKIKVQGTKFNVITPTEQYNFVEITVDEGVMEVSEKANPTNKVTITSQQKYIFDVEKRQFVNVSTPASTSKWKRFVKKLFKNTNY